MSPTTEQPVAPPARRPGFVRPVAGRRVGGVAAGLAAHTGLPVARVRTVLVALAVLAGAGVILYAVWWVLVPDERSATTQPHPTQPHPTQPRPTPSDWVLAHRDALVGGILVVVGAATAVRLSGLPLSMRVLLPVVVVVAGLVLAWSQLDAARRRRLVDGAGTGRGAALRVAAGASLVAAGVVALLVGGDPAALGASTLASIAVLAGMAIVAAPWAVRLWSDLGAERAALAREQERAELAAHVHDSVLQTLALIQRRSTEPDVSRLARAQERDLRRWLYGDHGQQEGTVGAGLRAAAEEVEDLTGSAVEVVVVGDLDGLALTRPTGALVQATREALLNAARHAGGTVDLYAERAGADLEVSVRDRGPGFDVSAIPDDRLGVRESIIGRMDRAGGSAQIRRPADGGTEIVLRLRVEDVTVENDAEEMS